MRRKVVWYWLAAYALMFAAVVWAMFAVRRSVLQEFGTPEAIAQWQAWREAEPNQSKSGPVARRVPSSNEPPTLVLLRDHFGVMLAAAVVFSSLLFGATMVMAYGVFGAKRAR
ncbi:MAG: hypothetical protein AB7O59_11500 [Pirellulales bacterium]